MTPPVPVPVPSVTPVDTGLAQPLTDAQLRAEAVAVEVATLPLPSGAAADGTDIESPAAMPAGGSGIRGWLSAIWTKINAGIAVTGTFWPETQPVSGTVTASKSKVASANTPSILTSGGDVIAANANRVSWYIKNLGTNPLFVRMGTGASSTVFHAVLPGGLAADDGLGGSVGGDDYTGVVSATGTSPRFVVTEL